MDRYRALQREWIEGGPPVRLLAAAYFKIGRGSKRGGRTRTPGAPNPRAPKKIGPPRTEEEIAAAARLPSAHGHGDDLGELCSMFPVVKVKA